MKHIRDILARERVFTLSGRNKTDILSEIIGLVAGAPQVTRPEKLLQAIIHREAIMSTGLGMGIAIPHAKIASVTDFVMAVGRSTGGIDYESLDDLPVQLVILIAASNTQSEEFLKLLAKIGAFFNSEVHRKRFLSAASDEDIFDLFIHLDDHNK